MREVAIALMSTSWDAIGKSFLSCKSCMWNPPDCLRVTVLVLRSFGSLETHLQRPDQLTDHLASFRRGGSSITDALRR